MLGMLIENNSTMILLRSILIGFCLDLLVASLAMYSSPVNQPSQIIPRPVKSDRASQTLDPAHGLASNVFFSHATLDCGSSTHCIYLSRQRGRGNFAVSCNTVDDEGEDRFVFSKSEEPYRVPMLK